MPGKLSTSNAAEDLALGDDFFFEAEVTGLEAADITRQTLIDTQQRMGLMLDVMPIGLLIHTRQGILFANQEACSLLLVSKEEAVGQHLFDFIGGHDMETAAALFEASFAGEKAMHDYDLVLDRRDETQRSVKLIFGRLPWQGNPVIQVLLQDITEQKRAEHTLRRLSITDELTGAFNRRHAFYEAGLYRPPNAGPDVGLSVVIVDIDHFKAVNDTYGHAGGDAALMRLAHIATATLSQSRLTDSGMFARIGGEEFLFLLPKVGQDEALRLAERFRRAVERELISHDGQIFGLTISAGVAEAEGPEDFDSLMSRADRNLYMAKTTGRNRIVS